MVSKQLANDYRSVIVQERSTVRRLLSLERGKFVTGELDWQGEGW